MAQECQREYYSYFYLRNLGIHLHKFYGVENKRPHPVGSYPDFFLVPGNVIHFFYERASASYGDPAVLGFHLLYHGAPVYFRCVF